MLSYGLLVSVSVPAFCFLAVRVLSPCHLCNCVVIDFDRVWDLILRASRRRKRKLRTWPRRLTISAVRSSEKRVFFLFSF